MKKALEIAKNLSKELTYSSENQFYVDFSLEASGSDRDEFFTIKKQSEKISIHGSNEASVVMALSQLKIALTGSSLENYLGNSQPFFALRPLWIHCDAHVALSDRVGIYLPGFFLNSNRKKFDLFCQRVLQLGFNMIVLGNEGTCFGEKSSILFKELAELYALFAECGIKLMIKPHIYFYDKDSIVFSPLVKETSQLMTWALNDLYRIAPDIEYLFWSSLYDHLDFQFHPVGRGKTRQDKVLTEIKILENTLPKKVKLIYFLPSKDQKESENQAHWLEDLLLDVNQLKTLIAFPADTSSYSIWKMLDSYKKLPKKSLLPIVNTGGVHLGEGLWPNIPFDFIDKYLTNANKECFAGMIHLAATMPRQGSCLDCALWVAGQAMWRELSADYLVKLWFHAFHSQIDFHSYLPILKKVGRLIQEISEICALISGPKYKKIDQEEMRFQGYRFLAECKEVECFVKKQQNLNGCFFFMNDQIKFFLRDVRNLMKKIFIRFDASVPKYLESEDKGDGFWNHSDLKKPIQIAGSPNIGAVGSVSHKIFWESNIAID